MYRIRLHGRGGQGIKTAGRILGTAFSLDGFEVQDAPLYGAERRGAPVFAYVRADRRPINERGIIQKPDLVAVADDSLISIPAAGITKGIGPHTVLLIRSEESSDTWKNRLNLSSAVIILPLLHEERGPDAHYAGVMLAASSARLVGVISRSSLVRAVREELSAYGESAVEAASNVALECYDLMSEYAGSIAEGIMQGAMAYERPGWIDLPFEDAEVSAPAVHAAATSQRVKTGLWRTMRPVLHHERCGKCWWFCSTFCPDSAISINSEGYPEIDYDHCKGCMICAARCMRHAIDIIPEGKEGRS